MGGPAGNLIVDLLDLIVNIYIILLFMRMFLTEYERYDAILDMVFQATRIDSKSPGRFYQHVTEGVCINYYHYLSIP